MNDTEQDEKRAHVRALAAKHAKKGDSTGWFDALYKEAAGDPEIIPWADMVPNRVFKEWAEGRDLKGNGRNALVVGCGLGDDALYLHDLGFQVTAFDISPTAVEWAKRLHKGTDIRFEVADLLKTPAEWTAAFDLVLEIYTIQPLPLELRPQVIDAVASFVAPDGELVVVCRGREDDEEPEQLPWPLSRRDLKRFTEKGLTETDFVVNLDTEDGQPRFLVQYHRKMA